MCRGTGKIRMQNRELVTPLAGSSDNYKTIQLSINPGLS